MDDDLDPPRGTGPVGQTLATKLDSIGHDVTIGTRDVTGTLARDANDTFGNPPYKVWAAAHPKVRLDTLANAAARGDVVINALSGAGALAGRALAGEANLAGKIVLDVSNPLRELRQRQPGWTLGYGARWLTTWSNASPSWGYSSKRVSGRDAGVT